MFKNVLVGVDGGPNGRDAIALASRLTDPDGKLTLAHVHIGPGFEAEEPEASKKLLERERAGSDVSAGLISIISESPGRGLHQQAEEQSADLLVIGSCSHGVFGRAMLGDDTRAALNGASCAVAIASRGYAEQGGRAVNPIANVGVGYDGSQESKAALATARQLAASWSATLHALEVVSIPTYAYGALMPPAVGDTIDVILKEATSRMSALPDVEARAVYGLTGEELAAFSDQLDILIVGSRSYGPIRRLVLGSTSDYLQRHARSSLLVLPRGAAN
jgi:nucleotide-binding universal stress UspA family protein